MGAAVFSVLLLLADLFPVKLGERWDWSTVDIGLIAAVVMLGPFWATISALPYAVRGGKRDWLRTAYETSCVTIEVFLAGLVFQFASGPLILGSPESTAPVVYATLAAGVMLLSVNITLNAGVLKVKYRQGFEESWKEFVEPYLLPARRSSSYSRVGDTDLAYERAGCGAGRSRRLSRESGARVPLTGAGEREPRVTGAGGVSGAGSHDFQYDVRDHGHKGPWREGWVHRPPRGGHSDVRGGSGPRDEAGRGPRRAAADGRSLAQHRAFRVARGSAPGDRQAQLHRPEPAGRARGAR